MLKAIHKRCGATHEIVEVIEYTNIWIKAICKDGETSWFGLDSYDFVMPV